MQARILVMTGSARRDSVNRRLAAQAALALEAAGAQVTRVEPNDYPLPLYDGDLEAESGLPDAALRLRSLFVAHDGMLIASPEYNGFFSPLLKNTIDWLSRPLAGAASPFAGKVAGLVAASPGALGGIRGLPHVRQLLGNLGVLVIPGQLAVARADGAFAADGRLLDAGQQQALAQIAADLVRTVTALKA